MTVLSEESRMIVWAKAQERAQARDLLTQSQGTVGPLLVRGGPEGSQEIPPALAAVITRVIETLARGGTLTVGSMPEEVTTTVAAQHLGVSRPTLIKLIDSGVIPARKVGTHRRLRSADVVAYKRQRLEEQKAAFAELLELEDELGLD